MRKPLLAGNWKMNNTVQESLAFAEAVKKPLAEFENVDSAICAPFTALAPLSHALEGSSILLGAQNIYWEEAGAFTGEISPLMLKELCQLVIIGHSERRGYFGETDETVNKKIKTALAHDLTPIVCVGESLEQNQAGETESFVSGQVRAAFDGISADSAKEIVIAYEPIWAIGTGLAATAEDADRIIRDVVRNTVRDLYGTEVSDSIRIQYGGSMKPSNVEELMSQADIDGGLVGGASLKADSFITLVEVSSRVKG